MATAPQQGPFQIPFQGVPQPTMNPMMMHPPPMQMPQNSTLYIGNLDKTVTENLIFDRFSRYGKIIRFQIMRDKVKNESRGFAFIEFQNLKDAEAAKNQLSNEKLQTRYIRVMWKGDHKKIDPNANVFVRDIDPALNQNDVESYFQRFGPVLSTYLSVNEKGESNRYGYIQFRSAEDAQKCLREAKDNKLIIGETPVIVEIFKTKSERDELRQANQRNLFFRDLPEEVTEDEIRGILAKFGKITNMVVNKNEEIHSAYAMVAMETREQAQNAIDDLNGKEKVLTNQSKPLFVTWHKSKHALKEDRRKARDQDRDLTLYMRNLKPEITKADLEKVLTNLGCSVAWINLRPFEATESPNSNIKYKTQYAFIRMNVKEHVQVVLGKKDDKEVQALFIKERAFIDIAMPKADRERMKAIQHRNRFPAAGPGGIPPFMLQARFPPQMAMYPPQMPWGGPMAPVMRGGFGGMGPRGPMRGGPRGPQGMRGGGPGGYQPRGRPPMGGGPQGHYPQHAQPRPQQPPPAPRQEAPKQPEPPKKLDLPTIKKNWENFKSLKAEDKRNILGEFLYPKVQGQIGLNLAPKITGMLVDFEVMTEEEIVEAIEDENILKQRIAEAREALEEAEAQ